MPRKDPTDPNRKKKNKKGNGPYNSKHVRKMESIMEKKSSQPKPVPKPGKKDKKDKTNESNSSLF